MTIGPIEMNQTCMEVENLFPTPIKQPLLETRLCNESDDCILPVFYNTLTTYSIFIGVNGVHILQNKACLSVKRRWHFHFPVISNALFVSVHKYSDEQGGKLNLR